MRTEVLLPRFTAYAAFDQRVSSWGADWLRSDTGSVWWSSEIDGAKIAVVGINTAWLCQDDEDWGKLTPGRYLLERAVDEALKEDPDLLIVLGHHPLDALSVEMEPKGDGPRVRERLKQANAIYLHGHLHTSGNDQIGDARHTALTIQAPSAFQAHDDDRWRNGMLWGEADLANGWLILEPLRWNEQRREYKFDADADYNNERVPGRDAFQLRLPRRGASVTAPLGEGRAPEALDLPPGWEVVDKDFTAEIHSHPPSTAEMVGFFDGMLPTWRLVLAPGVQPRAIVERLAARFRAAHQGAPKPEMVLLAGAGGEGKSTSILHAAAALVEDKEQDWTCFHRSAAAATLPENLFTHLPLKDDHAWIVVIDDADNIAPAILAAVQCLAPRTDVHLLLAARDAEWQIKQLVPNRWQPVADFRQEHLVGLDEEDAGRIVAGWMTWGDEAMGHSRGSSKESAVRALLGHARDLATRHEKGELLGALLVTRQGEDMRAHVRTLVDIR